ncbi:serine hydrolase FSH [Aspergillus pseudoustus]|uniref:Serine hydrolase FSH n=1 Tax=Aspergillus pseudoustus TaxID=1810923 RepID=A0ABR4K647_9EURO
MPRILCLHGHGTSGSIFKTQTASFRSKLPSYTFDFPSAPFPSKPSPGIESIFPDIPTYTWYPEPTPSALRAAHAWVRQYARENGPFDAVMCFSQGCSLIGSMALYHARDRHNGIIDVDVEPLPFHSAIFICGGVPLWALEDLGLPVPERAHALSKTTGTLLTSTAGKITLFARDVSQIQRGVGLWDGNGAHLLHDPDPAARPARSDVFGLDYTSFPEWARITIPTVHVYGAKDPRWPAGIQLAEFCADRSELDHGGGHDIPRSTWVAEGIAGLVVGVVARSWEGESERTRGHGVVDGAREG